MSAAMLKNLGYRVFSAETARAGLGILEAEPAIDLMLSDVVLPGGSGHAEQSIHLRTPLPEGSDLLDKPFRTIELAQRARAVLDR